jgi:hypothetical protein
MLPLGLLTHTLAHKQRVGPGVDQQNRDVPCAHLDLRRVRNFP